MFTPGPATEVGSVVGTTGVGDGTGVRVGMAGVLVAGSDWLVTGNCSGTEAVGTLVGNWSPWLQALNHSNAISSQQRFNRVNISPNYIASWLAGVGTIVLLEPVICLIRAVVAPGKESQ